MSDTHEFTHRMDRMNDALDRIASMLAMLVDRAPAGAIAAPQAGDKPLSPDEAFDALEAEQRARAEIEAADARSAAEQAANIAAALERIRTGAKPQPQASNVATMGRRGGGAATHGREAQAS